jgi:CPA2 family monovalent cation:H+ antiporter-2
MAHLPVLIQDLGLILTAGAVVTLIFKKLNQPVVLGYIIAGMLVGPHFKFFPTVTDIESIKTWAEIGVIFLLFGLGLEFSFKKLVRVGAPASITAVTEVIVMVALGFLTGKLLDWGFMDSIFLGGILSISSTTIIIRAFDELGVKGKRFASLVFGVLVVEDLVAILLLVLLSTIAVSRQFEGAELLSSIFKLGFFLVIWFVVGIFVFPTLLSRVKKFMNDESFLILSLSLCLLTVLLATHAGFSAALGAFIMGSILAETKEAEKIERIITPVKDLFAAVFFVSVGMLIDPFIISSQWGAILIITLVTIVGKLGSSSLGALLSGQPLRTSIQTGMSLAQIGEFSFIIATLGVTLGVTSEFLYPVAVAVSAITTFTTPYLIRLSGPFAEWVDAKLPETWKERLASYGSATQKISSYDQGRTLVKAVLGKLLLHATITLAIFSLGARYLHPVVLSRFPEGDLANIISLSFILLAGAPFLWALVLGRQEMQITEQEKPSNFKFLFIVFESVRILFATTLITGLVFQFFQKWWAVAIPLAVFGAGILFFSQRFELLYFKIESRFLANLNERERAEAAKNEANPQKKVPALAPWDAHISRFDIHPESEVIGKSLFNLGIREKFGVTIALIERGNRNLTAPSRDMVLYPFDRISAIGTDTQLDALKKFLTPSHPASSELNDVQDSRFRLDQVTISEKSSLVGKSIRTSGIREAADGLIVGVERDGKRILNPESDLPLMPGDLLWIVGDHDKIRQLK